MSVRAVENRFNLRSVVAEETSSKPVVLVQAQSAQSAISHTPSTKTGLQFDFSHLRTERVATPTKQTAATTPHISSFKNAFVNNHDTQKADVMRLTVVVDDLNARLRKATQKARDAESALHVAHAALVSERRSANDKLNSLTSKLGSAHAVEAQLRDELTRACKSIATHKASVPNIEAAVAAAVVSDGIAEKSRKEIKDLKEQLVVKDDKLAKASTEMDISRTRANEMSSIVAELEQQHANAKKDLVDAGDAYTKAVEERDVACKLLGEANKKMANMESTQHLNYAKVASLDTKDEAGAEIAHEPQPVEIANPSSLETQPQPISCPDPIKMHARYNKLRDTVMKLTAVISQIEDDESKVAAVKELKSKRDEIFVRANVLKSRYDTIFGASDPESGVEVPKKERIEMSFEPEGDAPDPPSTHVISFAREMARSCVLGSTFDVGSYDTGCPIGECVVSPITAGAESTERNDAHTDMVTAVITDLTRYLKNVKLVDESNEQAFRK